MSINQKKALILAFKIGIGSALAVFFCAFVLARKSDGGRDDHFVDSFDDKKRDV